MSARARLHALGAAAGLALLYPTLSSADNAAGPRWRLAQAAAPATPLSANALQALATGAMAAFEVSGAPVPVPDLPIVDAADKARPLKDWRGRVVLLNLWAMWCAPCLTEMPALDRLRQALGGADFDVLALNIDKAPERAQKFLADTGIKSLEFLRDPTTKAFALLQSRGMPTTLLIDRQGREIGRLVGPAVWDSAEAKALIAAAIAAR